MSTGHVAIVLEDQEEAAKRIMAVIRGRGDEVFWAKTRTEARALLEQHPPCYIVPDVEVPNELGDIPNELTGLAFIREDARGMFRGRTADDKHMVQILAMSGFSVEPGFVERVMQEGANAFITKPLPSNIEIERKIAEALRHSGRRDHADCARITEAARMSSRTPPAIAAASDPSRIVLRVLGDTVNGRTQVLVNGESAWLSAVLLKALLFLVVGRLRSADGWVECSEFGREATAIVRALSRLRVDLGVRVDGFDKSKGYRLLPAVDVEHVATAALAKMKDQATIVKLAAEIERLQKKRATR